MRASNFMKRIGKISALAALICTTATGMAFAGTYAPPPTIPTCGTPAALANPTQPCTDFFGFPNYANSPVPAGPVQTITVIDKGSNYSVPPAVTITDLFNPNASGATAVAILDGNGHVIGFTVTNGGSGYMAPQVSIAPPTVQGATATAQATIGGLLSGGIRKFVNGLPGLTAAGANNLGQYIPLANPDTASFPGSDYFVIGLKDHTEQMHADLAPTKIRGYYQVNAGTAGPTTDNSTRYLGPLILATKNRPTRILFQNELPTGSAGDLFLPTDTTYMGAGATPAPGDFYTQNRATLHLHGGNTPWISDGTPHQWITPPGETGTSALKGDAFRNVPDMVGPGTRIPTPTSSDGLGTFFWTNQQGERLMFYHDHAYGTTRLNVYAGEAAGYYVVDPLQEQALATATVPGTIITNPATGAIVSADLAHLVPLVIQDKTFVPSQDQLNATDPTWNSTLYGGAGNFWFPHVYMTNQDPEDPLNLNAFGRWDYGPWFVPPMTSLTAGPITIPCTSAAHPGLTVQCPITPNPSGTPEAFMDTPVINGTAYPVLHVAPEAYRFQILSAGNDRQVALSWFIAADANGTVCNGTQPQGTACTEVNMLPAVTPTNMPICSDVTAITNPALQIGLATATMDTAGNPINGTGLPAGCWPSTWPVTNGIVSAGLSGIVPDPRNAGPPWIQVGTEGGILPAPVVIPATPTTFETNPKSVTVGSMAIHGLFLGPAERADVIVDFSRFAGKTLILYNDGPTPDPGYDVRYDYFTGDADATSVGGAPMTQPGYGPNLRTIMQVIVDQPASAKAPFTLSALNTAFISGSVANNLFVRTQNAPVIPEPTYNSVYNANYPQVYSKIQDNYLSYLNFDGSLPKVTVTANGGGFTTAPTVVFTGGGCTTQPVAVATLTNDIVTDVTLTNPGAGCTSAPTVTFSGGGGTGATALVGSFMERKAIQELFTLDYGRLNATLGTELPFTSFLTQTTIPLGYIDPPTEMFKNGEVQLWRITHNGVDTHLMHFHLFNVQVINRVGWDGTVRPPDANELGWKDTVRMNPLEDAVVAILPLKQTLPFLMTDSVRNLDVTQPVGTTTQFTGVNPFTNNGMPTTNQPVNFGWEYVWHCHILGHEENDMMRPMVFQVTPEMPTGLNAAAGSLSWGNNSASATSFTIQQAADNAFTTGLTTIDYTVNGNPPAMDGQPFNPGPITYPNPVTGPFFRVAATKTFPARQSSVWTITPQTENLSSAWAYIAGSGAGPVAGVAPTSLTFNSQLVASASPVQPVTLSNTGTVPLSINGISFTGANPTDFTQTNNCLGTVAPAGSCTISVAFLPTASGARSASLAIASDDPASPLTLGLTGSATAPVAGITPTSFPVNNGANVLLNVGSFPMTFTLSNTGTAPLVINSIAVGGADPADFPITANTCVSPLATAANCSITVTFTAKAIGARSASLNIVNASPANSIAVPMNASVIAPIAAASPASLTYESLLLNTTSASQTATLSNTGNVPLNISGIALGGANPTDFSQTNNCPTVLAAGSSCTFNVTFSPVATGPRSATLDITDDSGNLAGSKQTVLLSGTGLSPDAVLSPPQPGPLVFPIMMLNTVSPPQTVTLANTGTGTLTIAGIATTGDFSQTNNCPATLAAGASCSISVSFTPTAAGARTGRLTITDNTNSVPGSFQFLDLNGSGTDFLIGTSTLVFSNQLVGTTSVVNTVSVTNTLATPISNIVLTLDGPNPADFILTGTCKGTLNGGKSCNINVKFKPTSLGSRTAFLNIASSDTAGTQKVFLTGTGVSPVNNVAPTALTFSSSQGTASAAQTVTVTNSGTAPMFITGITVTGPLGNQFTKTTTCGKSLNPGANCTLNVAFKPTKATPALMTATLNVKAKAPAISQTVALTGNVAVPVFTVAPNLDFGSDPTGVTTAAQPVTVTNTGTVPMIVKTIKLSGTNANQFAQTSTCIGAPLAVNASCTVSVTFKPTSTGGKTATLNVTSSAGNANSVTLTGTGI